MSKNKKTVEWYKRLAQQFSKSAGQLASTISEKILCYGWRMRNETAKHAREGRRKYRRHSNPVRSHIKCCHAVKWHGLIGLNPHYACKLVRSRCRSSMRLFPVANRSQSREQKGVSCSGLRGRYVITGHERCHFKLWNTRNENRGGGGGGGLAWGKITDVFVRWLQTII